MDEIGCANKTDSTQKIKEKLLWREHLSYPHSINK